MSYHDLLFMHKLLIQWKYRIKYGCELKNYEIKEQPDQTVAITISCLIGVHNGHPLNVTIPKRTFITPLSSITAANESEESNRLSKWLDEFDSDMHAQAKFVLENADGGIK